MDTAFAAKLARFPRLGLAQLPTSLEPLRRLSSFLGGPRLWVKREDASGLGFGGNKLRKLDYVLHEALAAKADVLISGGVAQSNSQRQVAAVAAKLGLECHLVVYQGRVAAAAADYETSGNALLIRLYGANLHAAPWTGDRNAAIHALAERLREQGRNPYVVPYGVSNALGAVAYATAAVEIAEQSRALGFEPAAVVACSGSAGTYCIVDASTIDAVKLAARLEAIVLDPVYSGKGLAGLIGLVRAGRWRLDEDVVFIHTGGAPALFAYRQALGF